MAICVCGRVKRKCMNQDLFEKIFKEFFLPQGELFIHNMGKCVVYEGFSDENKVTASFIKEKEPPYNVYDSNILNDEFEYGQLILFEIQKEEATVDCYKGIIKFFDYLRGKIDSDILVTSDVHNDICLLKGKEIIWSRNIPLDYRGFTQ